MAVEFMIGKGGHGQHRPTTMGWRAFVFQWPDAVWVLMESSKGKFYTYNPSTN